MDRERESEWENILSIHTTGDVMLIINYTISH